VRSVTAAGAVAVAIGLAAVGCSSSSSDSTIALATCEALRGVNNRITTIVNESVAGIGELAPDQRRAPVKEGLDRVGRELDAWAAQIGDLDLPEVSEGSEVSEIGMLGSQLSDGVVDAKAELDDRAAELAASDEPVPDDEVAGFVGNWFNAVEKVVSSIEPQIARFERREFKQAFLDEPACRNVVQPFVND
jgi:hypothetical protein